MSSDCLPEEMQSHVPCICLSFLYSAFLKSLELNRQSHLGCICLSFLHSAFSNDSSKDLDLKKVTLIAVVLDFSPVPFQLSPQRYWI